MKTIFFALLFSLLITGCNVSDAPAPTKDTITENDLDHIAVQPVSIDTILVQNDTNMLVRDISIAKLVIGELNGQIITQSSSSKNKTAAVIDTIRPDYEKKGDKFLLKFGKKIYVPDNISDFNLGVQFYGNNGSIFTISKSVKLPASLIYPEAERYILWQNINTFSTIKDFFLQNSVLYYICSGSPAVYTYNIENGNSGVISDTINADHSINLNDNYLFRDVQGYFIQKYNMKTGKALARAHPDVPNEWGIFGVAAADTLVYVLEGTTDYKSYLLTYSDSLKLISQVYVPREMDQLVYYKGILYSLDYQKNTIVRYDPKDGKFLKDKIPPINLYNDIWGFYISDDYFYYNYWTHKFIGRVPLNELSDAD